MRLLPPVRRRHRAPLRDEPRQLSLLDRLATHPTELDHGEVQTRRASTTTAAWSTPCSTAGIRPFPTLYHWDLPQALEEAGGWPARDTAGRFADYADILIRRLGDRVTDWILFNEPSVFTTFGYLVGAHAPGRRSLDDTLRATHVVNLAQGEAFRAMKASCPEARVGSAFSFSPCEPAGDSAGDEDAAERFHRFLNTWYLEPALHGRYPDVFRKACRGSRWGFATATSSSCGRRSTSSA